MASLHGEDYRAPTLLEAALILMLSKEKWFFDNESPYTCCPEKPIGGWKLTVGVRPAWGLRVYCIARHGA